MRFSSTRTVLVLLSMSLGVLSAANLLPGRALALSPQDAGASQPTSMTGCAIKNGSNMFLTDETSKITAQLKGGDVKTGRHIQVTGSLIPNAEPVSPATQVINVTAVKEIGGACKPIGAAAAGY